MGRIHVLSDPLINRIAAGEVVERPASVLKELVENCLDAGARSIEVSLVGGGKQSLQVTDDGCGMDRDDALLAVERHATSKLAAASDLDSIRTLGFRGEALSSIAAVSRFTLRTATGDGPGTEVVIHGGRIQDVRERGLPRGTTVRIERLFYNTPARRKFLRADGTELSHGLRWLTRYALVHPEHRFHLSHGDRRLLDLTPAADIGQRIAQIHGRDFLDKLLPFRQGFEGMSIHGFAGRPVEALPRRDAQHLFVNGRAVQDRVLTHAILQAYANTMPRGRFPAMFLFVEMDAAGVDVNVHPQKTEVRFRNTSEVHDRVRAAVGSALSRPEAIPALGELRPGEQEVRDATRRFLETREGSPGSPEFPRRTPAAGPRPDGGGGSEPHYGAPRGDGALLAAIHAAEDQEAPPRRRAQALVQLRESYIVAQDVEGMVLVDQHAAHERVLFEAYLHDAEQNRVAMQRLMFPAMVELAPHERSLLEAELEEFARLGFEIEPFGEGVVRIDAVPTVAADVEPETLLRELLGQAAEARSASADVGQLRRRLITSAACQAAIKINHPLARDSMQRLLDDLFRTENPSTCPHGRPAIFELSLEEIERAFHRR